MYEIIDEFNIGEYQFSVIFDSDGEIGGETFLDVTSSSEHLLSRVFYFDDSFNDSIDEFAERFAASAKFRDDSISGKAKWSRINGCFSLNNMIYSEPYAHILCKQRLKKEEKEQIGKLHTDLKNLYIITKNNIDKWEKPLQSKCYLRSHGEINKGLDRDIKNGALMLCQIPGIETGLSCHGARSVTESDWPVGPVWIPGNHYLNAAVVFDKIAPALAEELDQFLKHRNVGCCTKQKAESSDVAKNLDFCRAVEQFAQSRIALLTHGFRQTAAVRRAVM